MTAPVAQIAQTARKGKTSTVNIPIDLDTFNPYTIGYTNGVLDLKKNPVCLFIGRRGVGKTFCMECILWYVRYLPEAVVFAATEDGNGTWGRHFPDSFILTKFNDTHLQKVYDRQVERNWDRTIAMKRGVPDKDLPPLKRMLLILEDQGYQGRSLFEKPIVREILMNGRHFGITLFVTLQYCRDIGPGARDQVDYVFAMLDKKVLNRKKLYDDWFGVFPDFDSYDKCMIQCTSNRGVMVMDNTTLSGQIRDSVFWFRATNHGDFRFGSPQYWAWHYTHYDIDRAMQIRPRGDAEQEDEKKKPARKKPRVTLRAPRDELSEELHAVPKAKRNIIVSANMPQW